MSGFLRQILSTTFDFTGGWDYTKREAIDNLFEYRHAEDGSLLFVTLNNSKRERNKVRRRKDEHNRRYRNLADEQGKIVVHYVSSAAERNSYRAELIMDIKYKDRIEMLATGFRITRPKSVIQVP